LKLDKLNQWLSLGANIGVVLGLVFLAIEIRTNSATNRIATQATVSSNWVAINGAIANNPQLAELITKVRANEPLNDAETEQLRGRVGQFRSQAAFMRRLYLEGFATKEDVRNAYYSLLVWSKYDAVRSIIMERSEQLQRQVLEDDGLEEWLDNPTKMQRARSVSPAQ
jgi:hypothetical protein